jgi:hypothetical protein
MTVLSLKRGWSYHEPTPEFLLAINIYSLIAWKDAYISNSLLKF